VGALMQTVRNLGPLRLGLMGGVVFAMVGFFIFLTTKLSVPGMALLYGDLGPEDSARISAQLQSQQIPFEVKRGGAEIHVPNDRALSLRVTMSQQGMGGGVMGYEIFDKSGGLGTTNFMQNVNLVRALEGELARTIGTIDGVHKVRVHLVMPRRELFSRDKQSPSASIVLNMRGGGRLSKDQVSAVQHLVAAAVPQLTPVNISVVDEKGTLLAAGFEEEGGVGTMAAKAADQRRNFENRLARTVEELLERSVGFGNVRAEVSADMDYDHITENIESYDPDGQVVRSTQTTEERLESQEAENAQAVSVATNLPDAGADAGEGASATTTESRTDETVNYEITKKITNHVREGGILKRLSVAVLIDGTNITGDDGERIYTAREEEEMEQLAALVRTAVGFNADRGDVIEVINMRFTEGTDDIVEEVPLELFFGFDKNDLLRIAEILVLSIVAVLVILLVVRPLVTRFFEALPAAGAAAREGRLLADGGAPALAGPAPMPGELAPGEEGDLDEMIDLERVEGRVKASSVKKVGEIVEKHPEEALSIVRAWMYQEA
jgi:flagellar M-ring protein FliF